MQTHSDLVSENKKRKIPPAAGQPSLRSTFPRKRSFTACQLCRNRKTKCDNQRPSCSKCREMGVACKYQDQSERASSDPANQILDRLDYLIGLVESDAIIRPSNRSTDEEQSSGGEQGGSASPFPAPIEALQHASISSVTAADDGITIASRTVAHSKQPDASIQTYFGSSEDVLGWAIFEAKYDRRRIEALIFDPTLKSDRSSSPPTTPRVTDDSLRDRYEDPRHKSGIGRGVREEDIPQLVELFLLNVHTKNPIFDPEYLSNMAKSVLEHGFDWEARSCLVLIVCALATISSHYIRQKIHSEHLPSAEVEDSLMNTLSYSTAEAYYNASRKRMGLLTNTLIATECHFLAGVYEMYSLRPIQASISFNRACVAFQTLTWMKSEYYIAEGRLAKARASRLYWSCLKSEHEISVELRFPSSGLTRLNYTNSFPSPPTATPVEKLYDTPSDAGIESVSTQSPLVQQETEKAWYYYLADIAARRILQRVVDTFYKKSESAWCEASLPNLVQTAEELDRQLVQWHLTLPGVISFDVDRPADDELAYHLQARALEIKERIHRPFLYLTIHQEFTEAERSSLGPFVKTHIDTCLRLIQQWNVRHRHHGTWLMVRQSFASTLLLLAARKAGLAEVSDGRFEQALHSTMGILRYWEKEAPDLHASRLILEEIVQELCLSTFVGYTSPL